MTNLLGESIGVNTAHGDAESAGLKDIVVGEAFNELDLLVGVFEILRFDRYKTLMYSIKTYLGLAASSTNGASLAFRLQVWQTTSSIERGLVGGVGGLGGLDASDVKTTSGDEGGLVGELTQSTQGS